MPWDANGNWIDPVLLGGVAGAAGVAGAIPTSTSGSGSSSTTGSSQSSSGSNSTIQTLLNTLSKLTSQQQTTSTSTPTMSPEASAFMNNLISKYSSMGNVNLAPYQAQQSEAINRQSGLQSKAAENIMAARGLSTSPVAGTAQAGIESQRFGALTNLKQQIPLLQNQLTLQNLQGATQLAGVLPRGVTTTGTASGFQTGSTSQAGSTNATQSGFNNTNSTQNQNYNNQTQTGGGLGGLAGGLGAILAGLFP